MSSNMEATAKDDKKVPAEKPSEAPTQTKTVLRREGGLLASQNSVSSQEKPTNPAKNKSAKSAKSTKDAEETIMVAGIACPVYRPADSSERDRIRSGDVEELKTPVLLTTQKVTSLTKNGMIQVQLIGQTAAEMKANMYKQIREAQKILAQAKKDNEKKNADVTAEAPKESKTSAAKAETVGSEAAVGTSAHAAVPLEAKQEKIPCCSRYDEQNSRICHPYIGKLAATGTKHSDNKLAAKELEVKKANLDLLADLSAKNIACDFTVYQQAFSPKTLQLVAYHADLKNLSGWIGICARTNLKGVFEGHCQEIYNLAKWLRDEGNINFCVDTVCTKRDNDKKNAEGDVGSEAACPLEDAPSEASNKQVPCCPRYDEQNSQIFHPFIGKLDDISMEESNQAVDTAAAAELDAAKANLNLLVDLAAKNIACDFTVYQKAFSAKTLKIVAYHADMKKLRGWIGICARTNLKGVFEGRGEEIYSLAKWLRDEGNINFCVDTVEDFEEEVENTKVNKL